VSPPPQAPRTTDRTSGLQMRPCSRSERSRRCTASRVCSGSRRWRTSGGRRRGTPRLLARRLGQDLNIY
jgi:hypothetical protein